MDELLVLEEMANDWFNAGQNVRQPLYKEFQARLEELVDTMSPHRLETRNLVKVLAYDVLWQCPEMFAIVVYPDACSALYGCVNLAPLYQLYRMRLDRSQPPVHLTLAANSNRRAT
ncbi:MAG: hypothetical protein JWO84_714 [Parcubacteria group bacterium]|nr:hypothetical protein [Parcubacteria group bacterium]